MGDFEERLNHLLSDPAEMGKLAQMAQSLMEGGALGDLLGGGTERPPTVSKGASTAPQPHPEGEMLASIGKMLATASGQKNDKTALLEAMKPYLNQKRRDKMDKAMKLARMARLAGMAFSEFGGE